MLHRLKDEIVQALVPPIKYYLLLTISFYKLDSHAVIEAGFRSTTQSVLPGEDIFIDTHIDAIINNIGVFNSKGSNWVVKNCVSLSLHTVKYLPLAASSYINLPEKFHNTKFGLVNICNSDEKCFLWSILASLHPFSNNPQRLTHYLQYESELDMAGINYPTSLKDIGKFESHNNISVSVFGFEDKTIFPLRVSPLKESRHHVDLLLISEDDKRHYVLIKDIGTLIHHITKHKDKKFLCRHCLLFKNDQATFDRHVEDCKTFGPQKVEMPSDPMLRFKNFERQLPVPIVVYADFEAFIVHGKHVACSVGYFVQSTVPGITSSVTPEIYRGSDAVTHFLDKMLDLSKTATSILSVNVPMETHDNISAQTAIFAVNL